MWIVRGDHDDSSREQYGRFNDRALADGAMRDEAAKHAANEGHEMREEMSFPGAAFIYCANCKTAFHAGWN